MMNYLRKLNKDTLKKVSIITLIVAIVLIVGGSLATFNFDTLFEGVSTNKLSTCKLSLNVKDDNPITLVDASPISDEKTKEYSPYTFTITNKSGCNKAYYKITLKDICSTCSKTNDICTVNGQALNCSSSYKINSSKIKYELVNKKTNEIIKNVNPENISLTGQIAKNENITFELKLWIDSSATNEDLYVYENGKPKENSDGSIVTKNVGYKLNVEGQGSEFSNNLDKSGANEPLLASNMIPVYYDEASSSWKKADSENQNENYKWYDYDSKMWANAVTVSNTNRATYLSANPGTTIPMSDINAMFVWIPRYKYTYFSSGTPTEISITFENGTESTGTIKCTDAIEANSGKSEVCTDTTNGSLSIGKSTYTHPAFTFGSDELTGIWVGKFEVSSDEVTPDVSDTPTSPEVPTAPTLVIKPDVIPSMIIDEVPMFFEYSRNMELANNIYGFSQNGTTLNTVGEISGDSNNLDTHLIKNMEWGATSYLSHSKYGTCENGTCTEVGINNYIGDDLLTGCGASAGSGRSDVCNKYNTVEGKKASTTGNVYGIYDMSGGSYEYVMANMQDENNEFSVGLGEVWNTDIPLDRYYDKYSYDGYGRADGFSYGKLGDATIELKPDKKVTWYNDYAYFFMVDYPWFERGGNHYDGANAGLFEFECYVFNYSDVGTRVVLSVLS